MLTEASRPLLQSADTRLFRKPNQRSGKSPSRPGDTTKLEKQLPGGLEKVPLWPLILKRLEFLAEQEGLGPVSGQDAQPPSRRCRLAAQAQALPPPPPRRSPQPCGEQSREATQCPAFLCSAPTTCDCQSLCMHSSSGGEGRWGGWGRRKQHPSSYPAPQPGSPEVT